MLRRALLSDSGLSLLLHGLKSALALLVNWLVLARFASADYVTWAVTSSVLVVATASDLGIGQYTTTRLLHTPRNHWPAVLQEARAALLPLSFIGAVFVFFALGTQPAIYKVAIAIGIGLRILTIPSGALLNAVNQFKLRKAIEVAVYMVVVTVIAALSQVQAPIHWTLLALNVSFTVGGAATVVVAMRYMKSEEHPPLTVIGQHAQPLTTMYRNSFPYMVNNLTGLLTYGGFIWLSSLLLDTEALARLSVLHTFILINAYQVYDVLLKSRQGDLIHDAYVARMGRVNSILMVITPVLVMILGPTALSFFAPRLSFPNSELLLFATFLSLEFGFLYLQSIMQVDPAKAAMLNRCSWVKFIAQALAFCTFGFAVGSSPNLNGLLLCLVGGTGIGYVVCLAINGRLALSSSSRR